MHDVDVIEEPTTRAGFVKRLAKMAAIGLGVALIPATGALGATVVCCRSLSCDTSCFHCCPGNPYGYQCPGNPCGNCCFCSPTPTPSCLSGNQCPC
jgi:hypothetical protein